MNLRACLPVFILSAAAACAAADSKPVLMSTTGGGTSWADVTELKRDVDAQKPPALAAYGEMLLTGDQVEKDVAQGLAMLEQAAKAGQTSAAFRLGKVYDDGELAPRDAAKAVEYYRQAALAGSSEAQYNLGALYVSARGVKRDFAEGLAWLIVAGKHGAEGSGEQQVRDQLTRMRRQTVITAAEQRAAEIEKQLAAGK